jgi:hypothetical protein
MCAADEDHLSRVGCNPRNSARSLLKNSQPRIRGGGVCELFGEGAMADHGIAWRRDAETALDESKQSGRRALVDFTAAPM